MLRLLLAARTLVDGFGVDIGMRLRRVARHVALYAIAGLFAFIGFAAVAVALAVSLLDALGPVGAPLAVGLGFLVIAGLIVLIAVVGGGRRPRQAASPLGAIPEAAESAISGLGRSAAAAPLPWLIAALAAGALLGTRLAPGSRKMNED